MIDRPRWMKIYCPLNAKLAWCEICLHWKPAKSVHGRECRPCSEQRAFYEERMREVLAKIR